MNTDWTRCLAVILSGRAVWLVQKDSDIVDYAIRLNTGKIALEPRVGRYVSEEPLNWPRRYDHLGLEDLLAKLEVEYQSWTTDQTQIVQTGALVNPDGEFV